MIRDEDLQVIASAVLTAEKKTSGEIVPMLVAQSDSYSGAHWRMGIFLALSGAFMAYYAFPEWEAVWYLWLQLPLLALGYALAGIPPLKRALVGEKTMAEEVHQRAAQQFHLLGFANTRGRTGILLVVSLLEHRVEVIADVGINAKVPPGTWDGLVQAVLAKIREGDLRGGLVDAIGQAGKILEAHFPAEHVNEDELPNRLIVEL